MSPFPPHGVQGFVSASDAWNDAVRSLYGIPFCIMFKKGRYGGGDNYAWCGPDDYAERVAKSNGVEILSTHFNWYPHA